MELFFVIIIAGGLCALFRQKKDSGNRLDNRSNSITRDDMAGSGVGSCFLMEQVVDTDGSGKGRQGSLDTEMHEEILFAEDFLEDQDQ